MFVHHYDQDKHKHVSLQAVSNMNVVIVVYIHVGNILFRNHTEQKATYNNELNENECKNRT